MGGLAMAVVAATAALLWALWPSYGVSLLVARHGVWLGGGQPLPSRQRPAWTPPLTLSRGQRWAAAGDLRWPPVPPPGIGSPAGKLERAEGLAAALSIAVAAATVLGGVVRLRGRGGIPARLWTMVSLGEPEDFAPPAHLLEDPTVLKAYLQLRTTQELRRLEEARLARAAAEGPPAVWPPDTALDAVESLQQSMKDVRDATDALERATHSLAMQTERLLAAAAALEQPRRQDRPAPAEELPDPVVAKPTPASAAQQGPPEAKAKTSVLPADSPNVAGRQPAAAQPSADDALQQRAKAVGGRLLGELPKMSFVTRVAVSPDGGLLAGGGFDGLIVVWNATNGEMLSTFRRHTGNILALTFSTDGSQLLSASSDRTARLWDLATGTSIVLSGHTDWVHGAALSMDGSLAATAAADTSVRVWDASSGQCRAELQGHTMSVWDVCLSHGGTLLASASDDRTVRLWDPRQGTLLRTLVGHKSWVRSVTVSEDGTTVASGSDDGTVCVWDAATGALRHTLVGHADTVRAVHFSRDGHLLMTAAKDGAVRVWDTNRGSLLCTAPVPTNGTVSFANGEEFIAAVGEDGCIHLYDNGPPEDNGPPKDSGSLEGLGDP